MHLIFFYNKTFFNQRRCKRDYLGGGFKHFLFVNPILGEMIQFDEHIFQVGWINHHLLVVINLSPKKTSRNSSIRGIRKPPRLTDSFLKARLRSLNGREFFFLVAKAG